MRRALICIFGVIVILLISAVIVTCLFPTTESLTTRDNNTAKERMRRCVFSIDSFKNINHRLPTVSEFDKIVNGNSGNLGNTDYIRDDKFLDFRIKLQVRNIDWSKNYVLGVWRGEWWEYYISSSQKYIID
jgi:hypothetical protein